MTYWTPLRIKQLKEQGYKLHTCTFDINCKEPTCDWYKERERQEITEAQEED